MSARLRDPNYKSSYVKPKDAGVHYIEQLNQFLSKTENNRTPIYPNPKIWVGSTHLKTLSEITHSGTATFSNLKSCLSTYYLIKMASAAVKGKKSGTPNYKNDMLLNVIEAILPAGSEQ